MLTKFSLLFDALKAAFGSGEPLVRRLTAVILAFSAFFGGLFFPAQTDVQSVSENGSLVTVDALGRLVTTAGKSDKQVGIFYFLMAGEDGGFGPYNVTEIVENNPDAVLSEENWLAAGGNPVYTDAHWGEPLFGYYYAKDPWVLRKHCQMLTDAAFDFMVFDTTNSLIFEEGIQNLIAVWYEYMEAGWNVPKLAFYTNYLSGDTMNRIYDAFYNNAALKEKYPRLDELWFRIDDDADAKPMIIGDTEDPDLRSDVKDFFRIKTNQWPYQKKKKDGFPWMEFDRLLTFDALYKDTVNGKTVLNVSVAQHNDTGNFSEAAWYGGHDHSRSWHNGSLDSSENAVLYGYNLQEQWDFANATDPDIVFVTGWNEWVALRCAPKEWQGPITFVDNCNTECSRDCEPSAGILGDNYYMELIANVQKFKGSTTALPKAENMTVQINGDFSQWNNPKITSVYCDYTGDTANRSYQGYGSLYYTDTSGRNDIENMKVCQDSENVYFYVSTTEALTAPDGGAWMTLFLNTKGTEAGYDFVINRTAPQNGKTAVEAVNSNGAFTPCGEAEICYAGNQLMLKVPKSALTVADGTDAAFSFKWADNYIEGDIYSFYTKGDAAPCGRLNYAFH